MSERFRDRVFLDDFGGDRNLMDALSRYPASTCTETGICMPGLRTFGGNSNNRGFPFTLSIFLSISADFVSPGRVAAFDARIAARCWVICSLRTLTTEMQGSRVAAGCVGCSTTVAKRVVRPVAVGR